MDHSAQETRAAEEALFGVSLEQYAGVDAGTGAGHALDEVLAAEGIDAGAWPAAARGWSETLADDAEQSGLLGEVYDEMLLLAEERYARSVEPLASEMEAWMGFSAHFAAAADPLAWLHALGLRSQDVCALQARWIARIAADEALRTRMRDALKAPPPPLPELTITTPELRPRALPAEDAAQPDSVTMDGDKPAQEPLPFRSAPPRERLRTSRPSPLPAATPFDRPSVDHPAWNQKPRNIDT